MGYRVTPDDAKACALRIQEWIETGDRCRWLACLNPHSYVVARRDEAFRRALLDADWLIPDGAGVVLAARMVGRSIRGRVTGSDVFEQLHELLETRERPLGVFFLGSTPETLAAVRARMERDHPRVRVAGHYSPPFKAVFSEEDTEAMLAAVNGADADVLWVSMTAPKQERWIHHNLPRLRVRFAAAVGAVFDFYTGRVKRSHPLAQRWGLEWLPRLLREPRRLWRRTLISAPLFLVDAARFALRERLARRRGPADGTG